MENCLICGGLGYIEYETGVTDSVYKETLKEPCDCQEGKGAVLMKEEKWTVIYPILFVLLGWGIVYLITN